MGRSWRHDENHCLLGVVIRIHMALPRSFQKAREMRVRSRNWILGCAVAAILAAVYLYPCVRVSTEEHDEGISVLGAARLLQGQIPARDFVEVIGPGEFCWLALFFKLFGTTMFSAHLALLLAGVLLAVLFFHLAKRAGADPVISCSLLTFVSIPIMAINSYHWDSNLFALLSFAALIEWQRRRRAGLLMTSGAMAGAATLIMQQKGLMLCAALLLSAVCIDRVRWKRSAAIMLAPYSAILMAVGVFYIANGALRDLIWANIVWPVFRYSDVNNCAYAFHAGAYLKAFVVGFSALLPGYVAGPLGCFVVLPLFLVAALPGLLLAAGVRLRRKAFTPELIPFWVCGWALWVSECHRPDMSHLVFGSPILLITLLALLGMSAAPAWLNRVLFLSIVLFGAVNLGVFLSANTRVQTRRGTILVHAQDRALDFLQKHTQRGDDVFIYPYSPIYNFLSDTEDPTRYSYFIYGWHTPKQFEEAVMDLERKRVRYILSDTVITAESLVLRFPHYRAPAKAAQIMERYLDSHYREIDRENGFRILERIE